MTETADREDRIADFTRDKRILLLSLIAVVIGAISEAGDNAVDRFAG